MSRANLYTLETNKGELVVLSLEPGMDPWLAGVYFMRTNPDWDSMVFLTDMRPATKADVKAVDDVMVRGIVAVEECE